MSLFATNDPWSRTREQCPEWAIPVTSVCSRTLCSVDENRLDAGRRELGALLKAARTKAGLTQRDLRSKAGFKSHSRISEIETGVTVPSANEIERLLDALEITDLDKRESALGLLAQATGNPGELTVGPAIISETLVQLIGHERASRRIITGSISVLSGLLQTAATARAIHGDSAEAEARVALRVGRRDILMRSRDPVELVALIDSEALLRPIVDGDDLIEQVNHILDLGRRPNVTVQIVESTTRGFHPLLAGQFELIEFPTASPIVFLDHYRASVFVRNPEDVAAYMEAAEYLRKEVAMSPEDSSELIADIVRGMERQDDDDT